MRGLPVRAIQPHPQAATFTQPRHRLSRVRFVGFGFFAQDNRFDHLDQLLAAKRFEEQRIFLEAGLSGLHD